MPHKVVRGAVFTLADRTAFIEDYQRLGMHLNIWGWEVTTTRITVALVALVVRKSLPLPPFAPFEAAVAGPRVRTR